MVVPSLPPPAYLNPNDLSMTSSQSKAASAASSVPGTGAGAAAPVLSAWKNVSGTSTMSPRMEDGLIDSGIESNKSAVLGRRLSELSTSPTASASGPFAAYSLWGRSNERVEGISDSTLPMGADGFAAARDTRTDSIISLFSVASSSGANLGPDELAWETPATRRSSVASLNGANSWKCVGNGVGSLGSASVQEPRQRATSIVIDRPSFASVTSLANSAPERSFVYHRSSAGQSQTHQSVVPVLAEETASALNSPLDSYDGSRPSSVLSTGQYVMQLPASLHEEIGIDSVEEGSDIFKRSSMTNLLDFDPTDLFNSLKNGPTALEPSELHASLADGIGARRHSMSWLGSTASGNGSSSTWLSNSAIPPGNQALNGQPAPSSAAASSTASSLDGSPGPASSDTFPEEFIFAPSTAGGNHFSKKRFTRRHSIAVDAQTSLSASAAALPSLEDAFAQSLSLSSSTMALNASSTSIAGVNANAAEFIPSSLSYGELPFNGNIYAAYSGLFQNDLNLQPLVGLDSSSPPGSQSTFLSTMMKSTSASTSSLPPASSAAFLPNVHMPSFGSFNGTTSLSPAQAGIAPTVLNFPGVAFHLATHRGPLYLIEFKAGRTELFYVVDADPSVAVKVGDLVIVEADRGEDLGRITSEVPVARIRQLVSQIPAESLSASSFNGFGGHHAHHHHHSMSGGHYGGFDDHANGAGSGANMNHNLAGLKESEIAMLLATKEIAPKRIHRHAVQLDVKFLQTKAQEEAIAMARCRMRIQQKKLPMSVVDAEYQWDRNKLTFYFAADRRIDFRELVRDLFRIYKTRIWMCAVDKNRAALLNSLPQTAPFRAQS